MKKIIFLPYKICFSFMACAQENSEKMEQKLCISINGKKALATLEKNVSTAALVEKLKSENITYNAQDYGGFEKVGDLGFNLPTADRQMTSKSGDIFLYVGSSLVIFYGENSWSYTKIGTMDGMKCNEVKEFLCGEKGNVSVTLSLE